MKLKEILEEIRRNPNRDYAICHNVTNMCDFEMMDQMEDDLKILFRKWPKFSGSDSYPVISEDQYDQDLANDTFWKGESGELCRNLLDFCIEELSK